MNVLNGLRNAGTIGRSMGREIFISYSDKDARSLAERIEGELLAHGHHPWMYKTQLHGGDNWLLEVQLALDSADLVLAIISRGSSTSKICQGEQLRALRHGKCVIPILAHHDVEPPLYLESSFFLDFTSDANFSSVSQQLLASIEAGAGALLAARFRATYVTVPPLPLNYIERRDALTALRSVIMAPGASHSTAITALRGMGGIGKTVLAQALCYDEVIQDAFPDGIVWVTIGRYPADAVRPMREIAKALGEPLESYDTPEGSANRLRSVLRDRSILLVLDDVWNVRDITPFLVNVGSSRILVTTRDSRVGSALGANMLSVDTLSPKQSLVLLAHWVGQPVEGLTNEAHEIASQCGHLPLAIAIVGAMLRGKPDRWANVLHRLRTADLERIHQQFPDYPYPNLVMAIQVSVDELPPTTRARYLALAVFPDDTAIPESGLQRHWGADLLDVQDTCDFFVDLSLARRVKEGHLTLHDVQVDYVRMRTGPESLPRLHQHLLTAYGLSKNKYSLKDADKYLLENVAYHLVKANRKADLRKILLRMDDIELKIAGTNPSSLASDYEYFQDDPGMVAIQSAVRLSSHALLRHPSEIRTQMVGRLRGSELETVRRLLGQIRSKKQEGPWLRPVSASLIGPGGPLLATMDAHREGVRAVDISEDGKIAISASYSGEIKIWDLEREVELRSLTTDWFVRGLALSPSGQVAVSVAHSGCINKFSLPDGAVETEASGTGEWFASVAISKDQTLFAAGTVDGSITMWDTRNGPLQEKRQRAHRREITALAFSNDGEVLVSTSGDCTVKTWTTDSLSLIHGWGIDEPFQPKAEPFQTMAIAYGSFLLSGTETGDINLWNWRTGERLERLSSAGGPVESLSTSRDGSLLAAGFRHGGILVWDLANHKIIGKLRAQRDLTAVAVTGNGRRLISASRDGTLKLWDCASMAGKIYDTVQTQEILTLVVSPREDLVVSGAEGGRIIVWDARNGRQVNTLTGHTGSIRSAWFTCEGRRLVSCSQDHTLRVWELKTGKLIRILDGEPWRNTVALTPDGQFAGFIELENYADLRNAYFQADWACWDRHVPSRTFCVSVRRRMFVQVWSVERECEVSCFRAQRVVTSATISGDGSRVVTGSADGSLAVWETQNGTLLRTLDGHRGSVTGVAISFSGKVVVSSSADYTAYVWKVDNGERLATFTGDGPLTTCAIAGSGTLVAVGEESGALHILEFLVKPRASRKKEASKSPRKM